MHSKISSAKWRSFCQEASELMLPLHYNDVIMGMMVSQITSPTIVYPTVYSGADQREHQSSASLAFVRGIHRWPVNSPHKGPVKRKIFPFDDVIMVFHRPWVIEWSSGTTSPPPQQTVYREWEIPTRNQWVRTKYIASSLSYLLCSTLIIYNIEICRQFLKFL